MCLPLPTAVFAVQHTMEQLHQRLYGLQILQSFTLKTSTNKLMDSEDRAATSRGARETASNHPTREA